MSPATASAWLVAALLLPSPAVGQRRVELPLPDVGGFHTLKADFHLHSVFSDGEVWPTVHVREAWRDGLDAISLTEHVEYRPHARDVQGGADIAHLRASALAAQLGVVLVPGVEITKPAPGTASAWPTGSAHFNALFVSDVAALNVPDLYEALRRARAQQAFVFWNHPGFMNAPAQWFPHVAAAHEQGLFQGVEVVNGDRYYPEAFEWAQAKQLALLANSDAHLPMPAHLASKRRPITVLFVRTRDAAGIKDALEARRTAAWLDEDVWGADEWLRGLWSGAVEVENADVRAARGTAILLRVRNRSALAFAVRAAQLPAWLSLAAVTPAAITVAPLATTILRVNVSADAPDQGRVTSLPLEITNLHPAPGRGLAAGLAVTIAVAP